MRAIVGMEGGDAPAFDLGNVNLHDFGSYQIEQHIRSLASTCSMPSSSRLARRDLVWINVTPHPTADWIARQITEAFPWNESPRYVIRDRDQVYGVAVRHRLRAMGIRDKPIAPGSPW